MFGMGTGVTLSVRSPETCKGFRISKNANFEFEERHLEDTSPQFEFQISKLEIRQVLDDSILMGSRAREMLVMISL